MKCACVPWFLAPALVACAPPPDGVSSDSGLGLERHDGRHDALTAAAATSTVPLVPAGSVWRYWDRGTVTAGWQAPTFADADWPSGPAELGYGDHDEATVVSFGPSSGAKYV